MTKPNEHVGLERQQTDIEQLLSKGISAAKRGNHARAESLLLRVVEAEQRNERAWLWLSSVVRSDGDRRICLENVLALNPNSAAAQRGLARLALAGDGKGQATVEQIVRREVEPISPAAAVLFPERQVKEWRWRDDTPVHQVADVAFESRSSYDDVWESEEDICAYCAHRVDADSQRCPQCRRKLTGSHFRYPRSGPDLIVYFVLLLGLAQLFFINLLFDLITQTLLLTAVWHGFLFLVMATLAAGVYFRQFWAFSGSILILSFMAFMMLSELLIGSPVTELTAGLTGVDFFLAVADNAVATVVGPLGRFLPPLQLATALFALAYGILRAAADFERVTVRLLARVDKSAREASHFYTIGKEYAAVEMWASAVLHWQRAAAHDPGRWAYRRALGEAYVRLGFYRRSLDVLSSARELATDAQVKAELDELVHQVQAEQAAAVPAGAPLSG